MGKPGETSNNILVVRITCSNHTLQFIFAGTSAEGLVPSWYIAVAAVATCLLTAIVAIIIVLIIMRVCKKNQKNYGMKKANGIYEVDNPAYGVKK